MDVMIVLLLWATVITGLFWLRVKRRRLDAAVLFNSQQAPALTEEQEFVRIISTAREEEEVIFTHPFPIVHELSSEVEAWCAEMAEDVSLYLAHLEKDVHQWRSAMQVKMHQTLTLTGGA